MKLSLFKSTDIENIAKRAYITLSPEECAYFKTELTPVFQLIDELQMVNTESVQPLIYLSEYIQAEVGAWRLDQVQDFDLRTRYQEYAPQAQQGWYIVPQVIE